MFFRQACKEQAEALRVSGWAKNLPDGRVEIVAEGEAGAVESLARWAREGPPRARVTAVESFTEAPEGLAGFRTG